MDNGSKYILERSTDLTSWQTIDSNTYIGELMDQLSFSYTDQSPLPGRSFYRLQYISADGTITYSDVALYDNDVVSARPSGVPNPASQNITITGFGNDQLKIFNAFGFEVHRPTAKVFTDMRLTGQSLSI